MKKKEPFWKKTLQRCPAVGVLFKDGKWVFKFYDYASISGIVSYRAVRLDEDHLYAEKILGEAKKRGFIYAGTSGGEDIYVRRNCVLFAKEAAPRVIEITVVSLIDGSDPMKFVVELDSAHTTRKVLSALN